VKDDLLNFLCDARRDAKRVLQWIFQLLYLGSGAHPTSYLMGTRDSFPGGKATRAWSWPLTFI